MRQAPILLSLAHIVVVVVVGVAECVVVGNEDGRVVGECVLYEDSLGVCCVVGEGKHNGVQQHHHKHNRQPQKYLPPVARPMEKRQEDQ